MADINLSDKFPDLQPIKSVRRPRFLNNVRRLKNFALLGEGLLFLVRYCPG